MEAKKVAKTQKIAVEQEPAEKETPLTLVEFMTSVIGQLKAEKKHAAVRTYTSTRNSFVSFVTAEASSENEGALSLPETEEASPPAEVPLSVAAVFTPGRLKAYEVWLRMRGRKWNTVSTYMRTLQAVYNRIHAPGSFTHNPKLFEGVYTRVESLTKRALTVQQVNTLMVTELESLPENVRSALAYFLLMLYFRGMPFIDFAYLRKQDLQGDFIVYCRHKTGRQLTVRIPREAKALFEQFRDKNHRSTYLFPILDDKPKDDADVYDCYRQALRSFNKQLQTIATLLLPGVKQSSYTARHTWATLAFQNGIQIGIISKALGHSSIKVTETYLKPFENQKVDAANDKLLDLVANWNEKSTA